MNFIQSHPGQFELLKKIYNFRSDVARIGYDVDDFTKTLNDSKCEKIFMIVSYPDHEKFMKIGFNHKEKLISVVDPFTFYTNLNKKYTRKITGFDYIKFLTYYDLFPRPYYAYGLTLSAEIARRMSVNNLLACEFGVYTGTGLFAMSSIAKLISHESDINFKIFGFDTGEGLPEVGDWRDHPEIWYTGDMKMPNFENLKKTLYDNCELILGDVKNTISENYEKMFSDRILSFISIDVDTYQSTRSCLKIFTYDAKNYLPVIPTWVDDSYVNVFQSSYSGEALAIHEFNYSNLRKIDKKIIRTNRSQQVWHHCFYFTHIFDHPLRNNKNAHNFYINCHEF